MADSIRIVCLANSRKLAGRCIAGCEWTDQGAGRWIRPVSGRLHQEVSEYERQYEDGSDPRVLDIVDVPVQEPTPQGYQSENWLLDPHQYWSKVARKTLPVTRTGESGTTEWLRRVRFVGGSPW